MLHVNAKTDYGLLFMVALAESNRREPIGLREIARARKLPYQFLTHVVPPLKRAGLVLAKEGVRGGYRLSRKPSAISVGDVLRAIEGPLRLTRCTRREEGKCPSTAACPLPSFWDGVGAALLRSFDALPLSRLARSATHSGGR